MTNLSEEISVKSACPEPSVSNRNYSVQEWCHPRTPQMDSDRASIYNQHAEQGVLGCMLSGDEWISKAAEEVEQDFFYEPLHKAMFEVLVENNKSDQILLFTGLKKKLRDAYDGGRVSLLIEDCNRLIPSPHNLPSYITPLRECWLKRCLNGTLTEASSMLSNGDSYNDIAAKIDGHLSLQGDSSENEIKEHKDQLQQLVKHIEECQEGKRSPMGVSTGLSDLDYLSRGVQEGDMFVVAARPGVGKTTLGLNIAASAAIEDEVGVLFFSLEMDSTKLWQRILASISDVDMYSMEAKGKLTGKDLNSMMNKIGYMKKSGLRILDKPAQSIHQIRAACRSYCKHNDIKLVVIDYLQLVKCPGFKGNERQREVAEISLSLKALARELGVGFLVLAQINRENQRMGRRPQMSDLRESGAIECDADKIALLHQPDPEEDQVDLILDKNRNGNTGMVKLQFHKHINKFTEVDNFSV